MTVRLEEIRTIATGDASSYEGMARKVDVANKAMADSSDKAGKAIEATDRKVAGAGRGFARLVGELDPAARAVQKFEAGQATLARALETGRITVGRHAELMGRLRERYGSVSYALTAVGAASQAPARGLAVLATAAQTAEGRLKSGVRTMGDMRGTLELIGPAAGVAAGGLGTVAAVVGNVADAFGVLSLVLSRHPLLTIATVVAAGAAAYFFLSDATDDATAAQERYTKALADGLLVEQQSADAATRLAEQRKLAERQDRLTSVRIDLEGERQSLERRRAALLEDRDFFEGRGFVRREEVEGVRVELAEVEALLRLNEMRLTAVAAALAGVSEAYVALGRAAKLSATEVAGMLDAWEAARQPAIHPDLKRREEVLRSLATATEIYAEEVRKLDRDLRNETVGPAEYARAIENLNGWLYQTAPAFERVRIEIDRGAKAAADLVDAWEAARQPDVAGDLKRREAILKTLRTAEDEYADQVRELEIAFAKGDVAAELYARRLENLNAWLHEQSPAFQSAAQAAAEYAREVERVVARATDRVIDFGADALFDYLEGRREDFWAGMVTSARRAFAQMAAEAFLRPIVLPLIQGALGAAPGLFGLQQPAGFNPVSVVQGAQQAGSAMSFLNNPMGSLSNLFSPNNFLASAFPGLFGTSFAGAVPASALLGPGGVSMVGAGATGAIAGPLAGLAPFLPALAVALPLLLSSIFGGKKSVGPNANAIVNFERDAAGRLTDRGGLAIGGIGADNGGDAGVARQMAEAATKGVNTILDSLGARMTGFAGAGLSGQTELGYFKGKYFAQVGGARSEFGSAEEAVADFVRRALTHGTIEGLSADVRTALHNTAAADVERLGKDIDFADRFADSVALMNAGLGTLSEQAVRFRIAAEDAGKAEAKRVRDFLESADRLFPGADGTRSAAQVAARDALRTDLLGRVGLRQAGAGFERIPEPGDGSKPLAGWSARFAEAEARIRGLVPAFEAAGFSAEEIAEILPAALARARGDLREDFEKGLGDALLGARGQGYLVDLRQLEEGYEQAVADAATLGADLARVEETYAQMRLNAFEKFTYAQLEAAEDYYRAQRLMTDALQDQIDEALAAARARADADAASALGGVYALAERRRVEGLDRVLMGEIDANAELLSQHEALARAAEQSAAEFGRLRDSLDQTLLGLRVRNRAPAQRLEILQGEFRRLLGLALTGDKGALAQVGAAGQAYEEQARRYYGGGAGYQPLGDEIERGLDQARAVAELQRQIAEGQLSAEQRQVGLLEQIRDRLGGSGGSAAPQVGGSDFEGLVQAVQQFAAAKSGMGLSEAQIRSLPEWAYFEAQRREIVGRITDTSYLVDALYRHYGGRRTADANGDTGAVEIVARLRQLGVPGFDAGGTTGRVAFVHPRELLYTGPPARVFNPAESAVMMGGGPGQLAGLSQLIAAVEDNTRVSAQVGLDLKRTVEAQAAELGEMASALRRASVRS